MKKAISMITIEEKVKKHLFNQMGRKESQRRTSIRRTSIRNDLVNRPITIQTQRTTEKSVTANNDP